MKELKQYITNTAAGKFLSADDDGYAASYAILLKAKKNGNGGAVASSYVDVWESFGDETVEKLIEFIESEIHSLNEFVKTVNKLKSREASERKIKGVNRATEINLKASGSGTRDQLTESLNELIGFINNAADVRLTEGKDQFETPFVAASFR